MKAIIIDDEEKAAKGMVRLLENFCPTVEIMGVCTDGYESIDLIRKHLPEILFLDIEMPRLTGFEILEQINDISLNVIFTTAYDQYAVQAIKHNAFDYLLKPIDPDELIRVIDKLDGFIKRNEFIKTIELKYNEQNTNIEKAFKFQPELFVQYNLSKREIEIIELSLNVKSAKEISELLFLSINTVNNHLQNIYKKMNVTSRFELEKRIKDYTFSN